MTMFMLVMDLGDSSSVWKASRCDIEVIIRILASNGRASAVHGSETKSGVDIAWGMLVISVERQGF
jgi:hypothetical protein